MFSALVLIMSGFYALEYHPIRTIIHDPSTKYFTVYRGTKIISCQPISDFFIRMVAKNVGKFDKNKIRLQSCMYVCPYKVVKVLNIILLLTELESSHK